MIQNYLIGNYVNFDDQDNIKSYKKEAFRKLESRLLDPEGNSNLPVRMTIKVCQPDQSFFLIGIKQKESRSNFVLRSNALQQLSTLMLSGSNSVYHFLKGQTQICARAVDQRIQQLKKDVNLTSAHQKADDLFHKAMRANVDLEGDLLRSGLSPEQIKIIKKNAASVTDYKSFLMYAADSFHDATILGINSRHIIPGFANALQCRDYGDAYEEFFGDFIENAEFMPRLTATEKDIIFLVPHELMNHPQAGATKFEMEWLLSNPEKMSRVHFVFGVYDLVSKKTFKTIPYRDPKCLADQFKDALTTRLFTQMLGVKPENYSLSVDEIDLEYRVSTCTIEDLDSDSESSRPVTCPIIEDID